MNDLKTAKGQLAIASEFRFDYWRTGHQHKFYTVARGRRGYDHKWAILDGGEFGVSWDGADWGHWRGADMYCYELEEALPIARQLAFEENQRIIELMERDFPGQFRGGECDLSARKESSETVSAD